MAVATGLGGGTNADPGCAPGAFIVQDTTAGLRLLRFDQTTLDMTQITFLPGTSVNALAAAGSSLYAIARSPARAIRIGHDGAFADLGPIAGAPADNFAAAYSGAISGDHWYLLQDQVVYTVSLTARAVVRTAALASPIDIGDWAYWRGSLLGLSTVGRAELVSVNPVSGAVSVLAEPGGLPEGSSYGAAWLLNGQLHALHNATGQIFRLDPGNPSTPAVPVALLGSDTASSDGASCPAYTPPSPSPSPSPSTPPSPAPSPSTSEPPASPAPPSNPAPPWPSCPPASTAPPSASAVSPGPPAASAPAAFATPPTARRPGAAAGTAAFAAPPAARRPGRDLCAPAVEPVVTQAANPAPVPPLAQVPVVRPQAVAPAAVVPPARQTPARQPATGAPFVPRTAHRVLEPAALPDRSKTRRWVAVGAIVLGLGGLLGFIGANRNSR